LSTFHFKKFHFPLSTFHFKKFHFPNSDYAKSKVCLNHSLLRRLGAAGRLLFKIVLRGIFCQNAPLPKTVRRTVFEIHP
ncbi:MAG: hypothetical protein IIZ46_07565, partial [Clostridia bacterium]|nr:hypothetical protein [Clostridia bacterium]